MRLKTMASRDQIMILVRRMDFLNKMILEKKSHGISAVSDLAEIDAINVVLNELQYLREKLARRLTVPKRSDVEAEQGREKIWAVSKRLSYFNRLRLLDYLILMIITQPARKSEIKAEQDREEIWGLFKRLSTANRRKFLDHLTKIDPEGRSKNE